MDYSISAIPEASVLEQGELDEPVITVPIQLLQLSQGGFHCSSLNPSQPQLQNIQEPQIQFGIDKNVGQEANIISAGFNGQIVIRTNPDGTKSFLIDAPNISVSDAEDNILSLDQRLIEESDAGATPLNEREVIFQLGDDSTLNLNQFASSSIIPPNVVLPSTGYQYLSAKDLEIADSQVFLTQTDSEHLENSAPEDSLQGESQSLLSGQLMVTKLLRQDTALDDKIPDTQTITIDKDHPAKVLDDVDPPIGRGPWTCNKCDVTFEKWSQYKKHGRKHAEDKPYACNECPESFNILKNLKLHMSIHNTDELRCPDCEKVFRRLASLKAHLTVHQEEEIVTCETCFEEFYSVNQLELHKLSHTEQKNLIKRVTEPSIKIEPCDEKPPPALECQKCSTTFTSQLLLNNHVLLHKRMKKLAAKPRKKHTNRAMFEKKCSVCGKAFLKPSQLVRHMRIHTGERPFKCTYPGCGRAFNQKGTMLIHMDIHSGNRSHICELCGKSFVQKSNLRGHMGRVHPLSRDEAQFHCAECPCVFKRANTLNAHISRVHLLETYVNLTKSPQSDVEQLMKQLHDLENRADSKEDSPEKRSGSPSKDKTFTHKGHLMIADGDILQQALKNSGLAQQKDANGIKVEKNSEAENIKSLQKVKMVSLIDRINDGEIKRYSVLVRLHGDTKWYMCDFRGCNKEFKKPSDLVRHIRVHTHEKPYKCTICMRAFSIKATLMGHMKTHLTEKEYSCDVCKKKFTTATTLKTHTWVHTGKKPYQCSICPKMFRTISHRKSHVLTHSQSPYRLYALKKKNMPLPNIPLQEPILLTDKGPVKQTARYNNVYSNEGNKSTERPHRCRFCAAAFKRSSHLKQHERTHTGEKPYKCENCFKTFSSQSVLKSHLKVHSGARPYSCQTCRKEFSSRGSLKRHRTTHSTDRPYMCPYCHNKFKTNTNCKKHMKTHRQELAMNAIKEAGANLKGDSEQAFLTASLYGNQKQNQANKNAESETQRVTQETDIDSNSDLQIQATFSQDLEDGSISLTESQFQPISSLQSSQAPPTHTPLLLSNSSSLLSNSTLLSNGSKIILANSGDANTLHSINGYLIPPGVIFESYDYPLNAGDATEELATPTSADSLISSTEVSRNEVAKEIKTYRILPEQGENSMQNKNKEIELQEFYPSESILNVTSQSNVDGRPFFRPSEESRQSDSRLEFVVKTAKEVANKKNTKVPVSSSSFFYENSIVTTGVQESKEEDERDAHCVHLFPPASDEKEAKRADEGGARMGQGKRGGAKGAPNKRKRQVLKSASESDFESEGPGVEHRKRMRRKKATEARGKAQAARVKEESGDTHDKAPSPQKKFECAICRRVFPKMTQMNMHLRVHKNQHTCKQCGHIVASTSELKEHTKEHCPKICFLCNVTFSSQNTLINHIKSTHSDHVIEGQEKLFVETTEKNNFWQCPICKILFTSSEKIQKHMVIHSREEISSVINKDIEERSASGELSKLKVRLTSNAVDALLEESDLNRAEERLEINHPRSKVKEEEDFNKNLPNQCETCGKGFKKPSDLIRHVRTHTGEKPFVCKLCSKKFAVKSTLDVHLRTHNGKKEHHCTTCNTYYSSKGSLKIHMRLHTGLKPLKCFYCGMKFRTSGHRKAHIAKHFRIQNVKDLLQVKKDRTETSKEALDAAEEAQDIVGIADGQEALLPASVDIPGELEGINSVMISPDGTVTLQLNGMNLSGIDPSSILNLQAVGLDDAALDPMQYCNAVNLEFIGEAVDERGENTLSINPSVVMEEERESFTNADEMKNDGNGDFDVAEQDEPALITMEESLNSREGETTSNHGGEFAQVLTLPYIPIVGENNAIKCISCNESFIKISDWQEHMNSHNMIVKTTDIDQNSSLNQNLESDPLALSVKKQLFSSREASKQKLRNCPYANCRQRFPSEKDFQFHIDAAHNLNYECAICKEIFISQSAYQLHMSSEHCSKPIRCVICSAGFTQKDEFFTHVTQCHADRIITQTEPSGASKASEMKCSDDVTLSVSRSAIEEDNEDNDPLMIRDIFLAPQE